MADHRDLILAGGPVLTMDPAAPEAGALALRGASTQTVDLAGQCVLPGFIEAHGRPTNMALALAPPALDMRPFTEPNGAGLLRPSAPRWPPRTANPSLRTASISCSSATTTCTRARCRGSAPRTLRLQSFEGPDHPVQVPPQRMAPALPAQGQTGKILKREIRAPR